MKRRIKGLLLAVCMVVCMMLTACGSKDAWADSLDKFAPEEAANLKATAEQLLAQINSFTDEQIDGYIEGGDEFTKASMESWKNAKDDLGAYQSVIQQCVEEKDDQVIVKTQAQFEKRTATVELILNMKENVMASMSYNVDYTFGETMQQAGLNTLMGIGIVFLMLLFLSIIIAQFKHISKIEQKFAGKKEVAAPAKAPAAAPVQVEEELVDDGELIAVIAAAIATSENTSTDSFVVRSIKKANRKRWQNA